MTKTRQLSVRFLPSPFGSLAILWDIRDNRARIHRIILSNQNISAQDSVRKSFLGALKSSCSDIDGLAGQIQAFLEGDDIRFTVDNIRLDLCSAFQQKVLLAEHGIPRGQVSTYQRIAAHIGNPLAARAVGTALAGNPFPIIIACHRAIRSDRSTGEYQGGSGMKRALLEMEGISFDPKGRVVSNNLFY